MPWTPRRRAFGAQTGTRPTEWAVPIPWCTVASREKCRFRDCAPAGVTPPTPGVAERSRRASLLLIERQGVQAALIRYAFACVRRSLSACGGSSDRTSETRPFSGFDWKRDQETLLATNHARILDAFAAAATCNPRPSRPPPRSSPLINQPHTRSPPFAGTEPFSCRMRSSSPAPRRRASSCSSPTNTASNARWCPGPTSSTRLG